MKDGVKDIDTVCRLLELYKIAKSVNSNDIACFKTYKSNLYGLAKIYSFNYKDKRYYITDDYSLMDNPKFIRDIFGEIDDNLKGGPLKNPVPQSDGAKYALGFNETEYYLWEAPF